MDFLKNLIGFMNEPVPSFFFEVLFLEESDTLFGSATALMTRALDPVANAFTEVDGLNIAFDTDSFNEAGWSSPRPIFKSMKNEELTLTRYLRPRHIGMMTFGLDPITGWCQETMKSAKTWETQIVKKHVLIYIHHPMMQTPPPIASPSPFPVAGFLVREAFPTSWGVSPLSSTNSGEAIKETIKFGYTEIERLVIPTSPL